MIAFSFCGNYNYYNSLSYPIVLLSTHLINSLFRPIRSQNGMVQINNIKKMHEFLKDLLIPLFILWIVESSPSKCSARLLSKERHPGCSTESDAHQIVIVRRVVFKVAFHRGS